MKENKNNKGLIWLIIILIVLIMGLIGYIIYDKVVLNDKQNKEDEISTTTTTISSNNKEDATDTKDIILDFETEQENNIIEIGNELLNKYTENKYKVNLTIDNIKVKGNKHSIEIKNFDPYDYNCEEGINKVVYFNNEILYKPIGEGCYLTSLSKIIIFKNEYIIMHFFSEGGGWFNIFDATGNEIESKYNMRIAEIKSVEENVIKFIGWDQDIEDLTCKSNEYEMKIENNNINYTLIKKGEEDYCI